MFLFCFKRDDHTKWSKSEKEIFFNMSYDVPKSKKKKMMQMNLFTKQKQTHRIQKEAYSYQKGKFSGEG